MGRKDTSIARQSSTAASDRMGERLLGGEARYQRDREAAEQAFAAEAQRRIRDHAPASAFRPLRQKRTQVAVQPTQRDPTGGRNHTAPWGVRGSPPEQVWWGGRDSNP
ncbi:hypothetical protein Adu01nite_75940 [Paractinoplanes durhamensis]|uniref:Uncharacterized protein n=1 Tax=Paractinoplanes durhamensis TaxID=113563 RepID=A0ABQ3Z8U0_9ACTN|nr:hypothetical protein Adu01nite_75940 [Actinoplanes durhamensis]